MSHEHEVSTADPDWPPADALEPRAESCPEFLDRARRILAGDIRPEDYLPVPESVRREVDEYLASVEREIGGPVTAAGRQQVLNDATYHFHHAADTTLTKNTDRGVLVLAVGSEQIYQVCRHFNPDYRSGFVHQSVITG